MFLPFLLLLSVFLRGLAPDMYWKDSAEFISMADQLSITHPPGHSTACVLFSSFRYLPLGSFPFRVNLVCALSMAGAAAVFGGLLRFLCVEWLGMKRGQVGVASVVAALSVGMGRDLWHFAACAEVYAPLLLLMMIALYCLRRERPSLEGALLVTGLAFACHLKTLVLLPCLLAWILPFLSRRRITWTVLMRSGSALLMGSSMILFMPIRSAARPFMDWDTTSTLTGFITHISAKQFQQAMVIPAWPTFLWGLSALGETLVDTVTPVGLILGGVGMVFGVVKHGFWGLLPLCFLAVEALYGLLINPEGMEYREAWHLIFFLSVTYLCGGCVWLLGFRGRKEQRVLILLLLLLFPCWIYFRNVPFSCRRRSISASDYALHLKKAMDRNAFVVMPAGAQGFLFWCLQGMEGQIQNTRILYREGLKWYGHPAYLQRVWDFPIEEVLRRYALQADPSNQRWDLWVSWQVAEMHRAQGGRPAYWSVDGQEASLPLGRRLVLSDANLLARIVPFDLHDPLPGREYPSLWEWLPRESRSSFGHFLDEHANREIAAMHNMLGIFLANAGDLKSAGIAFDHALEMLSTRANAQANAKTHMNKGILLLMMDEGVDAMVEFKRALSIYGGSADIWFWLGEMEARSGNRMAATEAWTRALSLDSGHVASRRRLSLPSEE